MGGFQRGGTSKLFENICHSDIYIFLFLKRLLISKKLVSYLEPFQTLSLEGVFGGVSRGGYPQTMSKYLSVKYLLISNNTDTPGKAIQKSDFRGSIWGVPGDLPLRDPKRWCPQIMSKYLFVKYLLISKNTSTLS